MGKLVWLASYPKSGNTWLRAFLHNYLRRAETPHDINALMDLSAGEAATALYRVHDPRPPESWTVDDVLRLRPRVHHDLTRAWPDLVFVKTHNAAVALRGVKLVTPEVTAGAIYLVRDPRDVAVSYAHHLGLPLDAVIALMADPAAAAGGDERHVYQYLGTWSAHVQSWTPRPDPRRLVLRYEDLLADPARGFGDVIRLLGQEPPPDLLDRAVRFSGFETLRAQEAEHGFGEAPKTVTRFFRAGRAGQWREAMTPTQADRIARDHGVVMARFGYL